MLRPLRLLVPLAVLVAVACAAPAASPTAPASSDAAAAKPAAATDGGASSGSSGPITINYGHPVVSSLYWHLFVAEEKGMYADEGIDFKRTFVQAGYPAIAQGIVAGAYQLGSVAADTAVPAIQNGADLVYVGGEMHMPVFGIIAQPEIKSFADIKNGKKIGVASIRGGTSMVLRVVFAQHGLKEGTDYNMVQAGSTSERVAGLKSKSIDVGLMGQPQDFQMQDEGFTSLGLTSDFVKDFGFAEVWAKRDWAAANEDAVVRFLRANSRAIDWLYNPANKEEAIQILMRATKTEEQYARRTYQLLIEDLKAFVPKGEPSAATIDSAIKVLMETGELQSASVTGEQVLDKRYWQKAQETLR